MQANKAVRQSLADHLTSEQAGFDAASVSMFGANCNPAPKKNPKPPKARFVFLCLRFQLLTLFQLVHDEGERNPC